MECTKVRDVEKKGTHIIRNKQKRELRKELKEA